jgi:hypothetical protein
VQRVHGDNRTTLCAGDVMMKPVEWTDAKNHKRCELVDKEIDGTLTDEEAPELMVLQVEMLAYRRKIAPLPLDDLHTIHQQLLQRDQQHDS